MEGLLIVLLKDEAEKKLFQKKLFDSALHGKRSLGSRYYIAPFTLKYYYTEIILLFWQLDSRFKFSDFFFPLSNERAAFKNPRGRKYIILSDTISY